MGTVDWLRGLLGDALNFVFPPICSLCRTALLSHEQVVCGRCFGDIAVIRDDFCPRCGRPLSGGSPCVSCPHKEFAFSEARAVGVYRDVLPGVIRSLKYRNRKSLARKLGRLMVQVAGAAYFRGERPVIVPVPLYASRLRERGYNQSELLARWVSSESQTPLVVGSLVRRRPTRSQTKLSVSEREENVKDAFGVRRPHELGGRTVILVDDVFTTGATLDACSRKLLEAGAVQVRVLTAAVAC